MKTKLRLDQYVQEQYPALSRRHIQSLIMQGKVTVDGKVQTKAGAQIGPDAKVLVDQTEPKYVSRAGFKLEHALEHFGIDVHDNIIMDAGLSTGGFTDCLLQAGAKKIYGVDVGRGQVHEKISNDSRVVVMERTHLNHVRDLGELVDLVTLDLSFISVLKVMDAVCAVLKSTGGLVVLIKPQFEAGRGQVGRGGIVTDPNVHQTVVEKVTQGIIDHGFSLVGVIPSPILGSEGNKEFLAYFKRLPAQ